MWRMRGQCRRPSRFFLGCRRVRVIGAAKPQAVKAVHRLRFRSADERKPSILIRPRGIALSRRRVGRKGDG